MENDEQNMNSKKFLQHSTYEIIFLNYKILYSDNVVNHPAGQFQSVKHIIGSHRHYRQPTDLHHLSLKRKMRIEVKL